MIKVFLISLGISVSVGKTSCHTSFALAFGKNIIESRNTALLC